ncbi:hypothetical protein TrVFT333_010346 [Trichoderma virens FT-333]|nr:hypothetical protein TrVFT333_010346 [Trichoderma virens FT-333]
MMNGRRGGRPRSRERNPTKRPNTRTEVEDFNKPDYPSLKGAPSTKRQYTYGAAEEPRRLSVDSMPATLQDAMHGVLRRQARQEAEEAADLQRHGQHLKPQVARRYNPARQADDTESESDVESNQLSRGRDNGKHRQGLKPAATKLANPNNTAKVAFDQSFSRPASEDEDEIDDDEDGELTPSESDVSDSRSFNAEGDYFGNASFRSMPPPLAVKPIPLSKTTKPSVPPPSSLSSRPPATRDQYEQATPNRIREAPGKAWSAVKSLLGGRVLAPVSPPESDTQLSQGVSTGTLLEQSQSTTRMRIPKASTIITVKWTMLCKTTFERPKAKFHDKRNGGAFSRLDELRGDQYAEFGDMINQILRDLRLMKGAGKLHESSIEKLNAVVPKMVHMTLKDGKPVVAQDFWHAIRDLVEKDGSFPMLNKSKAGHYEPSSEKQWKDIAAWLARRPEIASKINEANDGLAKKLPHMWEAWATDNQRKVEQTLRPILDKMKITGSLSDKDIDKRLDQLIKKHVGSSKSGSTVVTREYFLQYLKDEFASHRAEMKAEIIELQPKLEQLIRDTVDLAKKDDSSSITRAEVTKLVDSLVRKSIADLNLEAMAKGRIRSHWDRDLKNQLNYFGVGAGAIIDPKQTSTTFRPDAKYLNDKGLKGAQPYAPIEALLPWHDDGDCWCAAREVNKRGNPHGAKLSVIMGHSIIPQHIVIEHILPGATSNPGARPRQIEVYIKIEDAAIRERLLDFSAAHFPEDLFDWNYAPADLPPQFVKVTQFVYEGAELHDGVHVHRLSSELMALNAETDQVIVRAVSNYGAPNHTCFYRIRLFGHKVPELGDE